MDVKSISYNIIGYPVRFSIIKFQSITRIILSGHASSIFYREVMSLCEILANGALLSCNPLNKSSWQIAFCLQCLSKFEKKISTLVYIQVKWS